MISSENNNSDKLGIDTIYLASDSFQDLKCAMETIPNIKICEGHIETALKKHDDRPTDENKDEKSRNVMRVEYDPEKISLDAILFAFFRIVGLEIMTQQRSAKNSAYALEIYYENEQLKDRIERICSIEKERHRPIEVKIGPLPSTYHEDDIDCHDDYESIRNQLHYKKNQIISKMIVDPVNYRKPSDKDIAHKLTPEQYSITQKGMTERPFSSDHNKRREIGIYVDVVTGEPLFSSEDKFDTSCGWPGFSSTIDDNAILELNDDSYGMHRIEVRSRAGNSHLGHVFNNDPESPNGTRFCINGASLRFVPLDSMKREGYGYLIPLFKKNIN
jgi:peptide methionine sulfoxide reductase msrA/msrB